MKDGIKQIVGKTITSIVVGKNDRSSPHNQVFLIFDDGSSFEMWGEHISCAGGTDKGGVSEVVSYIERGGGAVSACYPIKS